MKKIVFLKKQVALSNICNSFANALLSLFNFQSAVLSLLPLDTGF